MNNRKTDTNDKKSVKIRHPPPLVSCGKDEMALMQYIKSLGKERFNIKAYSRDHYKDISRRSKVYYYLNKLIQKDLIHSPIISDHKLTDLGEKYLNPQYCSVKNHRRGCRENQLSVHFIKYKLPISDKIDFNEKRLKELNPLRTHKIAWNNDFIHYAYFEDSTIIINPKVIFIKIHDIIGKNAEDVNFETLTKALNYMTRLTKIGLKTASIEMERPHYARVKSYLADFLKKNVDNRYYLELENGTKFWIDCSPPNELEDETNSETARTRIDKFMSKIMNEDINFDDLKDIKEIVGMMVTFEAMKMRESLKPKEDIKLERPDYFG